MERFYGRILRLTMIRPAEIYSGVHQDDIVSFGRTTPWSSGTNRWDRLHDLSTGTAMDAHSPRSYHHQNLISAEIFYLTELVCQPRITGQTDNIMSSYKAFLNWYQNFFTLFKKKESGPPFIHCIQRQITNKSKVFYTTFVCFACSTLSLSQGPSRGPTSSLIGYVYKLHTRSSHCPGPSLECMAR